MLIGGILKTGFLRGCLYLDVIPEVAYQRILRRNQDQPLEFKERIGYMRKAHALYQYYLQQEMYCNVVIVDSSDTDWVQLERIPSCIEATLGSMVM